MFAPSGNYSMQQEVMLVLEQNREVLYSLGGGPLSSAGSGRAHRASGLQISAFQSSDQGKEERARGKFRVTGRTGEKHGTVVFEVLRKEGSSRPVYTAIVVKPDRGSAIKVL